MAKKPIKDLASRRKYYHLSIAVHRAKKAKSLADIQKSINCHHEKIGLLLKNLTKPKHSSKGYHRVIYLPPEEELAKMSKQELSAWKKEEQRKRKIQRAHEKKVLDEIEMRELKEELANLVECVRQLDDGVKKFAKPVTNEGLGKMNGVLDGKNGVVGEKSLQLEAVYHDKGTEVGFKNFKIEVDTKVPKPELTKSEFNMEIDRAQYVESHTNPEDVKLVDNLDTKHAPKNKHVITEPDASDATLTTIGMFKLDLEAPSLEEFDLIQFDPTSDDLYVDANRVGMLDDSSITVDHGFSTNDKLLVADSMPDFVDSVGLLGDENLLSGNALVRVFDD